MRSRRALHFTPQAWRATVLPPASVASLGKAVAGYFHGSRPCPIIFFAVVARTTLHSHTSFLALATCLLCLI
jgi:hypothetical protein